LARALRYSADMPEFLRRKRGRPPSPGTFTPAEARLLPFLARGLTNAEIAARPG
jgi:DNA-binding NarL/FixJ family response regulator